MKPEVFTILPGFSACEWIREVHPFKYLNRHGITARILPEDDLKLLEESGLPSYNILLLPRRVPTKGAEPMLALIQTEQLRGKKVLYECDDDPFSLRFSSVPGEIARVLSACDGCIVTTPALAERVKPYVKPYVFRNYLDGELWDQFERQDSSDIVVGISGSHTHYEDWQIVARPLHRLARHPKVRFLAFGYLPDYLADLPRLEYVPPVGYRQYPAALKRITIGLAPLIVDAGGFNRYKSDIKALDYQLAGAAALCSKHSVYQPAKGGAVLVANDEWFDVLDHYVTHPADLLRQRRRGEAWVRRNRLLRDGWKELADALQRVLRS